MCGITGLYHLHGGSRPDPELLGRMTDTLRHRGPDGRGVFLDGAVGLGHRRLAVIDLSARAHQPMPSTSGHTVVTFNGEIYNFLELRQELMAMGLRFDSASDTEILVNGYEAWGEDLPNRLNGIFAFAIWDKKRQRLFLARDRFGVKPLFYHLSNGVFRFGSEIKAILEDRTVTRRVDPRGVDAFLTFGYIPAPGTGFAEIRQLPPGVCLSVDTHGMRFSSFHSTLPIPQAEISFPEALEHFSFLLRQAVKRQMVSDVPLGAFLSGGIDSTVIAHQLVESSSLPVSTFTIGFDQSGYDESISARHTATRLGTRHQEEKITLEMDETLSQTIHHSEDPFADSSLLAVYHLCRMARKHVTVALSGDGADELMAGYPTYTASLLSRVARMFLPAWGRKYLLHPLAARLPRTKHPYGIREVSLRLLEGLDQEGLHCHTVWRRIFSLQTREKTLRPEWLGATASFRPLDDYSRMIDTAPPGTPALRRLLDADLGFYLPSDMLVKVDRMSMAHGLEVRVPFLDNDLVAFLRSLPPGFLLSWNGEKKRILKQHARRHMPWFDTSLPKHGFNVPIGDGFRGKLGNLLEETMAAGPFREDGPFSPEGVAGLLARHRSGVGEHGYELFTILTLGLWWNHFRPSPPGPM